MSGAYLAPGLPAPVPSPDGLDAPYWAGARAHELRIQRCDQCAAFQWGPEWICHRCLSFEVGWAPVSGRGRIYSWERVWHPVHPALKEQGPYLIVLVDLCDADDVRVIGNLLGDPAQPVEIGAEVEAVFEDHDDAPHPYTLVQWRRLESTA